VEEEAISLNFEDHIDYDMEMDIKESKAQLA